MPKLGRTTPCQGCPWRVTSLPGYLGDDDPVHFYWASVTTEGDMPCHEQIDYSDPAWEVTQLPSADLCAGMLIHYRNSLKVPRRRHLEVAVRAVKASAAVFSWPWEFMTHHMPGATAEQVKRAWQQAILPGKPVTEKTRQVTAP
jgi:hypothetical protein